MFGKLLEVPFRWAKSYERGRLLQHGQCSVGKTNHIVLGFLSTSYPRVEKSQIAGPAILLMGKSHV